MQEVKNICPWSSGQLIHESKRVRLPGWLSGPVLIGRVNGLDIAGPNAITGILEVQSRMVCICEARLVATFQRLHETILDL